MRRSLVALALLAVAAPSAHAITQDEILAKLNAQRTANGFPAVTESPLWSSRCLAHTHYEALNDYLGHEEDPSKPGYSEEGRLGGIWGNQSRGSDWAAGNPWENAPWHLQFLLEPRKQQYGFAQSEGFNCASGGNGDLPQSPSPAGDQFYFYGYSPAGGTVPHMQTAFEAPATPQTYVGITDGTPTGPNLMVWAWSPSTEQISELRNLRSATLTGPSGPVEVRVVNNTNFPPSYEAFGFVIPVAPLEVGKQYTLDAVFESGPQDPDSAAPERTATFTKTFTTDDRWLAGIALQHGPEDVSGIGALPKLTAVKVPAKVRLKDAAAKGVAVRFTAPRAASMTAVLLDSKRFLVAKAIRRKVRAGPVSVRFRFLRGVAKALVRRGHGRARLTVQIAVAGVEPIKRTLLLTK